MTLKFIDIELPVPGFFQLLHFCSTMKFFPALGRPTWHLIHDHESIKCSCQGCRILHIEIQQLSFTAVCGESFVKCDMVGNTTLLGDRPACARS